MKDLCDLFVFIGPWLVVVENFDKQFCKDPKLFIIVLFGTQICLTLRDFIFVPLGTQIGIVFTCLGLYQQLLLLCPYFLQIVHIELT